MSDNIHNTLKFWCFARISAIIAIHTGFILGLFFAITNSGRRVNFGPYFFDNQAANFFVFTFWLFASALIITMISVLCYYPAVRFVRWTGGIQFRRG